MTEQRESKEREKENTQTAKPPTSCPSLRRYCSFDWLIQLDWETTQKQPPSIPAPPVTDTAWTGHTSIAIHPQRRRRAANHHQPSSSVPYIHIQIQKAHPRRRCYRYYCDVIQIWKSRHTQDKDTHKKRNKNKRERKKERKTKNISYRHVHGRP